MILLKIDVRKFLDGKVSKGAKIRNRYNQSLHTYLLCEFSGDWDNTTRATYIVVIFLGGLFWILARNSSPSHQYVREGEKKKNGIDYKRPKHLPNFTSSEELFSCQQIETKSCRREHTTLPPTLNIEC